MGKFAVVYSEAIDKQWLEQIKRALENDSFFWLTATELLGERTFDFSHMLLLCDLNEIGREEGVDRLLLYWKRQPEVDPVLRHTTVALLVRSTNSFHTKTYSREVIWLLNTMGASVIGRPVVECLPEYENMGMWVKKMARPPEELYESLIRDLAQRLKHTETSRLKKPHMVVLHSSDEKTSNTLALWRMVQNSAKEIRPDVNFHEIYIKRGTITDCIGCPYEICTSEANQLNCVLGGQFVEEIMPAIVAADVLIWLCPNYNDTIGGDLIALINRMSGLYRTRDLSDIKIYGVVVSGNSGSDTVAKQLVGSLIINKGFQLPPYFCLSEISGEPLSILKKQGAREKAKMFAQQILLENCE